MCTSTIASALRASETSREIAARLPRTRPATRLMCDLPTGPGRAVNVRNAETLRCHKCGRVSPRDLVPVGRDRRSELRRH